MQQLDKMEKNRKNNFRAWANYSKRTLKRELPNLRKISQTKMTWTYNEKLAKLENSLKEWENDLKGWAIIILRYADRHPQKISKRDISLATGFSKDGYILYSNKTVDLTDSFAVDEFLQEKNMKNPKIHLWSFRKSYSSFCKLRKEVAEVKKQHEERLKKHKCVNINPNDVFAD